MSTGGRKIVANILRNIDGTDVFACDLTYLNSNVSFELGYAIGRFKRIWISLDTSVDQAEQKYRRTYFGLTGAGYTKYTNSIDLAEAFLRENPTNDLGNTLLGSLYKQAMPRQEVPTLFYVKPPINTDAVITATETIQNSSFRDSLIIDDPIENPSPTLDWYALGKLGMADAVLFHLLGDHQVERLDYNAKCSIIAGISKGFKKSMLMVAHPAIRIPS